MTWEKVDDKCMLPGVGWVMLFRCRVPGGWLVVLEIVGNNSITFYPDPDHEWNP